TEREVQLNILYYLNEVEHRRLYLSMAYGSLFEFCMEYLGYSKSSAGRRIRAARCIDRFPGAAGLFRSGELNLCALSMISGILTEENAGEILAWVRGRPFRDIEILVARHRPGQIIRDRVKPVFIMNPDTTRGGVNTPGCIHVQSEGDNSNAGLNVEPKCKASFTFTPNVGSEKFPKSKSNVTVMPGTGNTGSGPGAGEPERVVVTQKFKIEFAVGPEFMRDLERARSLLSTRDPKRLGFEKLFGILLKEYLDRHSPESRIKKREQRRENKKNRDTAKCNRPGEAKETGKKRTGAARTRHIPQSIRDEVLVRDGGRCAYVGPDGKRCNEKNNLQIDHIIPYAKGGNNTPGNLRLLCFKHNQLEAEREYGAEHMEKYNRKE
ncbi:MAG TPA: HNH endonuclease signature motif containing protein, partial [Patescibacteria group bacterium]|nr:HNH endonuclease signature motif containing protein [Patescibacteria group bacterium]